MSISKQKEVYCYKETPEISEFVLNHAGLRAPDLKHTSTRCTNHSCSGSGDALNPKHEKKTTQSDYTADSTRIWKMMLMEIW